MAKQVCTGAITTAQYKHNQQRLIRDKFEIREWFRNGETFSRLGHSWAKLEDETRILQ